MITSQVLSELSQISMYIGLEVWSELLYYFFFVSIWEVNIVVYFILEMSSLINI